MDQNDPTMNASDIARSLIQRLAWEAEHGTIGYSVNAAPPTHVSPTPSPPSQSVQPPAAPAPIKRSPAIERQVEAHAPDAPDATDTPDVTAAPSQTHEAPKPKQQRRKPTSLQEMATALVKCRRCELHKGRSNVVFGEGNKDARLVFVGEGPGRDEDQTGSPFVGAAGKLLDKIISAMGLERNDVYICNVVKCRPPSNRVPTQSEQDICGRFLEYQLELIKPEAIVALGSTAAQYLLGETQSIGGLRGRFHDRNGVKIIPTYHPAYLLRSPEKKREVWLDMQVVMKELGLTADSERSNP